MAKLVNKTEALEIIKGNELVIVDFFASWCGPCQMFLPIFDEVSGTIEGATLIKVDIDQETDFASENEVMGIPTIVAFKGGTEVARFSGFKSAEELTAFINENK